MLTPFAGLNLSLQECHCGLQSVSVLPLFSPHPWQGLKVWIPIRERSELQDLPVYRETTFLPLSSYKESDGRLVATFVASCGCTLAWIQVNPQGDGSYATTLLS